MLVVQPLLAKLTPKNFGEILGPSALVLGSYIISSSVRTVGSSAKTVGQGRDGRGPPLTLVLKRGVRAAERGMMTATCDCQEQRYVDRHALLSLYS